LKAVSKETILLSPIGDFDADILHAVEAMVPDVFSLLCHIQPLIDNIDFAWDARRRQFHSTVILEELSANAPLNAHKIIALTHHDLFIPILTHVYGEAQLGGRSSIVSTCRLADGISVVSRRATYLMRIVKETAHELGHTFDLRHCKDNRCLMHYCRSIGDVDTKTGQFCRYCRVLLSDHLKKIRSQSPTALKKN